MIRNLGLALLAILLALALCEGLLRLFGADVLPKLRQPASAVAA